MEAQLDLFTCQCARFKVYGKCVHTQPSFEPMKRSRNQLAQGMLKKLRAEKKRDRADEHKKSEPDDVQWALVGKLEWKQMPRMHGVWLWCDKQDNLWYYGHTQDLWRMHFQAFRNGDKRLEHIAKIWWCPTAWYLELVKEFDSLAKLHTYVKVEPTALRNMLEMLKNIDVVLPAPPIATRR